MVPGTVGSGRCCAGCVAFCVFVAVSTGAGAICACRTGAGAGVPVDTAGAVVRGAAVVAVATGRAVAGVVVVTAGTVAVVLDGLLVTATGTAVCGVTTSTVAWCGCASATTETMPPRVRASAADAPKLRAVLMSGAAFLLGAALVASL